MIRGKVSKEQARRIKQEKEFQVRRDFLARERDYGKANLAKFTKKWSKMLKEIGCEHLRREVLAFWHHFEKVVDYKEVVISMFLDWLDEQNVRHWMSLTNHNDLVEYLITFFYRGHKWIYNELGTQVNKLIDLWVKDYNENRVRAITNEEYLETMKYQMSCIKKREEYETVTKNFSIINEKTTKYKVLLGDITFTLSDKFESLHWKTKQFTYDYFASIKKLQKMGAESMERYEAFQKDIDSNHRKNKKLEKLIHVLLRKYKELFSTNEQKLEELSKERDSLHECFLIFRENLFYDKRNDMKKRKVLTVSFNDNFRQLEEIARKGKILMKCLGACRRYETEEEKMMPYPEEVVPEDKHQDPRHIDISKELSLFWNRLAAVDANTH
ncbi:dynein regulatory complex subunit 2-like isoform X3 [Coccinella septempunctata]|uniref:dynein regulatory complex subunit 2-like isoform X3 n=1 Tax=Coccinella septempunctata TaxID=41139 RepID=UPI001D07A2AA|nr:dynein regulatory complex subunit 2-like isoform X3 [Coccinella septempunctata]